MLKQSEQMTLTRRGKLQSGMVSGEISRGPGPLEVVAADSAVDVTANGGDVVTCEYESCVRIRTRTQR